MPNEAAPPAHQGAEDEKVAEIVNRHQPGLVYPWSHLSNPMQIEKCAEHIVDTLVAALTNARQPEMLSQDLEFASRDTKVDVVQNLFNQWQGGGHPGLVDAIRRLLDEARQPVADMKAAMIVAVLSLFGKDCPDCPNRGYTVRQTDDDDGCEMEQCQFCYVEPLSKYNITTKLEPLPSGPQTEQEDKR